MSGFQTDGKAWMVRLHRGDRYVIGLRRHAADRFFEQITDLLADRRSDSS